VSVAAAALPAKHPVDAARISDIRALANTLAGEGRVKDASLLLEHLAAVRPGDAETLRPLVKLLGAEGRTLEAIETLSQLKDSSTDLASLVGDIQSQMAPAIDCFNRHLAAGEVEKAERYASAMVALVPRNVSLLNAALSCNVALGNKERAAKYASTLLSIDATHAAASSVLAETEKPAGADADEIEQRLAFALQPKTGEHPLLRLRDMHDVMSAILCRPLNERSVEQIERILAAARELEVPVPPDSEWVVWEKHYRLMLEAADVPAVLAATPEPLGEPDAELLTSAGKPLNWKELRAEAARTGAECVFFAAADRHYIDLYARWYVKSILKHCDVPCVIIVHVIGGAGQLKDVVKSVGIRDKRLFFTADRFDADAVATRCYDTPPKGRIAKPVAHFQSIRFMRLGALLRKLKRPVFVSDIDLLLQRGVRDLLSRCKDTDVAFNENTISMNAGSRLTANLLLVHPTANAALFLRFLRSYLERMLARPEVTRWIDQFGLLMARHHLSLKATDPRIAYFDTSTDINNVMYPSYRDNPFRFLSLYHGFDLSSLEGNPNVASDRPERARPQRNHR
jgi:tetratricopeptide (TPR) repeat protein